MGQMVTAVLYSNAKNAIFALLTLGNTIIHERNLSMKPAIACLVWTNAMN
jgi:hypothetical protein